MDFIDHGTNRIIILCGKYEGRTKHCADFLYGELAPKVPYILTITEEHKFPEEKYGEFNIIAVGTAESNAFLKKLCDKNLLTAPENPEGYRIKIFDNPFNAEKQIFALTGGGDTGSLYAVSEFCQRYLQYAEQTHDHNHYFIPPFTQKMPECDYEQSPKISERGIWTWGHVIFDFKRFADNMVRLKMNTLIIWNDHAPLNAKEMVDYAHLSGIKLIWGISFGWGYDYDISDSGALEKIVDDALDNYEKNYSHTGCDGLYFQTFTETETSDKNGMSIAAQAASFVNLARRKATERFGNIRLQFGLHATSVKEKLEELQSVSNDVEIVWEDCGAFPFAYVAKKTDKFEETCDLVKKVANLRGEDDNFSVVLKGLCCLDWSIFEHQKGSFIAGKYCARDVSARYEQKKKVWRYQNAYWLKNADKAHTMMNVIQKETNGKTMVAALIEDGLFEEKINLGAAVMGMLMWDCERDIKDTLCDAALLPDVEF